MIMIIVNKKILLFLSVILMVVIYYFGYNYYAKNKIRVANRVAYERGLYIKNVFKDLVDNQKMTDGFWYTTIDMYGNEILSYFDLSVLIKNGATDEEIRAIYEEIKNSRVSPKSSFQSVPENELPPNIQFHNAILTSPLVYNENKYLDIKKALVSSYLSNKATKDELIRLSYIYGLEGNYKERDLINKKLCLDFKFNCSKGVAVEIIGSVRDGRGYNIQNAEVSVFGDNTLIPIFTNVDGNYKLSINVNEFEKIRLKVTKRGFSDAVVNITVLNSNIKRYNPDTAIINSSNSIFTLDTIKKTITGLENKIEGNNAIVKTSQSIYTIPLNVFFDKNGNQFFGQMEIVAFEFNRATAPLSILEVDTFDSARGYAGNLMQTYGMPYVQFFAKNGDEIFVKASNPIKLTYNMYHIKDLYSGNANEPSEVSLKDIETVLEFSQKSTSKYPIERQFLIDNELTQIPAWWIFDQSKGVWDNVGYSLINKDGKIETIFYTIKDI